MSKHTPGPWSVGRTTKQDVDSRLGPMFQTPIHVGSGADKGNALAIAYLGGPGATSVARESVEANANLIAAAPDLLAAVADVIEAVEADGEIDLDALRKLIAKAEGRES